MSRQEHDDAYADAYIEGWESFVAGDHNPWPYPEADEADDLYDADGYCINADHGRALGLVDGWDGASASHFHQIQGARGVDYNKQMYDKFCEKRGHTMKNKFKDEKGNFDELAFRQHCISIAQQHAPRGAIAGANGPEPIGETLQRAQLIERYLKDGKVDLPQGNGATAA